jgi:hypothetical protein
MHLNSCVLKEDGMSVGFHHAQDYLSRKGILYRTAIPAEYDFGVAGTIAPDGLQSVDGLERQDGHDPENAKKFCEWMESNGYNNYSGFGEGMLAHDELDISVHQSGYFNLLKWIAGSIIRKYFDGLEDRYADKLAHFAVEYLNAGIICKKFDWIPAYLEKVIDRLDWSPLYEALSGFYKVGSLDIKDGMETVRDMYGNGWTDVRRTIDISIEGLGRQKNTSGDVELLDALEGLDGQTIDRIQRDYDKAVTILSVVGIGPGMMNLLLNERLCHRIGLTRKDRLDE